MPLPRSFKDVLKKLLHIEDTPERTALAYSVGVLIGFSPFLGLHTLLALAIAFLWNLNRVAILIGIWMNTPWWIIPYYSAATWVGLNLTGHEINRSTVGEIFQAGMHQGFLSSGFWDRIFAQGGLLFSFLLGSLILAALLALAAYPLSLRWIRFYRSRRKT